ncbi:hypothetical protein HK101_010096 [Irineochytrium annulatum]|nr:hypothetical protein HK101_010096 [Irineochytrium annulatum]
MHDHQECLAIRVCRVDDDAWVSACLGALSGGILDHHRAGACRVLVSAGRVHLIPVLMHGHEGEPDDVCLALGAKFIAGAIFQSAKRGLRDAATFLAEATGFGRDVDRTKRFLIDLGAAPTSCGFMDYLDYRYEGRREGLHDKVLPERVEDDPLLHLMSTSATYEPTRREFRCAWQLVQRGCLLQQLIDLNIVEASYIDVCLDQLELGARVSSTTFANAVCHGSLDFLHLIAPHKEEKMEKDGSVAYSMVANGAALDPDCCQFVLDLGFPVSAGVIAQLVSAGRLFGSNLDVLRVLAEMLKAAEKDKASILEDCDVRHDDATYSSVLEAALCSRCDREPEPRYDHSRVYPQVMLLLRFGFVPTAR